MSTNRKRRSRYLRLTLHPIIRYFLIYGTLRGGPPFDESMTDVDWFLFQERELREAWNEAGEKLLADWKGPGQLWALNKFGPPER
jgi:hypothetical protein